MTGIISYAPVAATGFAVPQFLPQLLRLRRTADASGVSWLWAALTSLQNGAWIAYCGSGWQPEGGTGMRCRIGTFPHSRG
jgi:hypothetical protein